LNNAIVEARRAFESGTKRLYLQLDEKNHKEENDELERRQQVKTSQVLELKPS